MIYVCPKCGNMTNFYVQANCSCDYNQKTQKTSNNLKKREKVLGN